MAEIQDNGGGKKGKGSKQKKMTVRVDFTPMVDMNMLLITFFMLCTSLSKPQTMEISMPTNDENITEDQQNKVKASQALTLLLDANNKLYYYEGEPNYEDYTSLKETDYTADGIRKVLLRKNYDAVKKVEELKVKKANLEITEEEYKKQVSEVKSAKNTPTWPWNAAPRCSSTAGCPKRFRRKPRPRWAFRSRTSRTRAATTNS